MTSTKPHGQASAGVLVRPPLVALGALLFGLALQWLAPLGLLGRLEAPLRWAIGAVLIALGAPLFALAMRGFSRAGTPVRTSQATTQLVTTGVYAHVRNPIYVAFTLLLIGVAAVAAADWLVVTTA